LKTPALLTLVLGLGAAAPAFANQNGLASWYSLPGQRTACGERMNPGALTAAHRTLPCGAKVKVTNRRNGRSVVVRINDRGPFKKGRVVDVSKAAAQRIGLVSSGLAPVSVTRVD
jgi:rare lipoprotein A